MADQNENTPAEGGPQADSSDPGTDSAPSGEVLLTIGGMSKRFGPTRALQDVSLQVRAGEVLALIGENGAGKSTLLKTLSGAHRADRGSMELCRTPFHPRGPHHARLSGVAMIYQELNLAPDLSVEDNVLLGLSGSGGGLLFRTRQRERVRQALGTVGLSHLDPQALVSRQSVATQQLIEIARALISEARIILFDEPTSSLPQKDVQRLFEIVGKLKRSGIGIIYISHFLEEVRTVADTYAVLRDGRMVGSGRIDDVSDEQVVSLMVGRDVDDLFPTVPHTPGEPWIKVEKLTGAPYPRQVDLRLRRGEIFGVAGLVGAGRTELLRTMFGLDQVTSGKVHVGGLPIGGSVRARMRSGFGLLSEDRKNEGLAQDLSIIENITLGALDQYTTWGVIALHRRRRSATQFMRQVAVKAQAGTQAVSELSGGNQQKVAIARILHQQADILMLDEPTKGIDVGTKAEIYRLMGELAAAGKTVLFVSSYLPELLAVCDRIAVMARGEVREVRDTADWSEEDVMTAAIALDDQPN
ncbi:MAG: sugar ABC transporter ATP-binding protein [Pirellulales bacterium]|nr:sugar ABC transporter ATP-binding protein [Pirellulales bacterium]